MPSQTGLPSQTVRNAISVRITNPDRKEFHRSPYYHLRPKGIPSHSVLPAQTGLPSQTVRNTIADRITISDHYPGVEYSVCPVVLPWWYSVCHVCVSRLHRWRRRKHADLVPLSSGPTRRSALLTSLRRRRPTSRRRHPSRRTTRAPHPNPPPLWTWVATPYNGSSSNSISFRMFGTEDSNTYNKQDKSKEPKSTMPKASANSV